jgi:hypothetical protein
MIDDDDKPATPPAADDKPAPPPAPEGRPELLNAHLKHESGAVKGVGAEMQQLVIDPYRRLAVLLHQDGRLPGAPAGRPRKLAADTEQTMQQVLLEAIVDYRGRHEGALPNDQIIMDAACKIAEHVGVSVSDKTLKRRVIKPVVKGLRQGK